MNWGLTQGMLGARQRTLVPSALALGPNSYAGQFDFIKMLGAAMLLHAIVLGIVGIWPEERVTDIPVRALTFKIGDGRITAPPVRIVGTPVQPQPIITAPPANTHEWRAAPKPVAAPAPKPKPVPKPLPKAKPQPVKQPKLVPMVPREQRQMPAENQQALAPAPAPTRSVPSEQPLPDTAPLTSQAAIAPTPQRFIRETGAPAVASSPAESAQVARVRYEMEISGWIQRHYLYPPSATVKKEGRAVIRMRIDRTGYVRFYAIEESAGSDILDAAAIDTIRRANPMPAVPDNYPAGNLIEFLIPIVFRIPR